jgi:hypothetical protein
VINYRKNSSTRNGVMDIPEDPRERKKWMMEILKGYAEDFHICDPEDQPNVFARQEPDYRKLKSGNRNPQEIKSWRHLKFTHEFLQERYGLFSDSSFITDCPLHKLHPLEGEDPKRFRKALQLVAEGEIGFVCRRYIGCPRRHCELKNQRVIDISDLVALLDRKGREHARKILSAYWEDRYGEKLGHFPKDGRTQIPKDRMHEADLPERYSVPKIELEKLLRIPHKGKGAGLRFAEKALEVFVGSPLVPYDGHSSDTEDAILFSKSFDWKTTLPRLGSGGRLFIWLHWKQAEKGSKLVLSDRDVARALGVDRKTIQRTKQKLFSHGLLEVTPADEKKSHWSAKYRQKEG